MKINFPQNQDKVKFSELAKGEMFSLENNKGDVFMRVGDGLGKPYMVSLESGNLSWADDKLKVTPVYAELCVINLDKEER